MLGSFLESLANVVFGPRRYRIMVRYAPTPNAPTVADFSINIGVSDVRAITDARAIKRYLASDIRELVQGVLRYTSHPGNGFVYAEPVAYLGRWKERKKHVQQRQS